MPDIVIALPLLAVCITCLAWYAIGNIMDALVATTLLWSMSLLYFMAWTADKMYPYRNAAVTRETRPIIPHCHG